MNKQKKNKKRRDLGSNRKRLCIKYKNCYNSKLSKKCSTVSKNVISNKQVKFKQFIHKLFSTILYNLLEYYTGRIILIIILLIKFVLSKF
jgi:hypothetical protein